MDLVLLAVAAVWGGATGLLIPRAAYRFAVQPEEPWRTACPAGHAFTGPLGGWWGRARCTPCASRVQTSVRYGDEAEAPVAYGEETEPPAPLPYAYAPGALAPLITVLACLGLAAATGSRPELAAWLLLAPPAVLLATVDRRVHRLPDPLTLPLAAAAVLLLGGAALLPGHAGSWASGLLGGLVLGGFYLLLFLINPNGMGFGDVKLALALGVALGWYGWEVLFLGGFAGFLFGAAYGLGLVLLRRAGRKTGIPFGPFMIAGALVGVLLGALAA
ncbi:MULTISPECIES: prepilin peptidase [unclassified Streptomyces]|uniref:prepilin peptidase n=1 Tax=unclassified Streptomyces TaxID=2593676 RepID=UPI001929AFD0|nr:MULTISPECIES: A24 family peptidase [unclassified Streptomyces]CAD5951381.1 Prepilin peptidase [Streptomyces sp. KY70]CAD5984158.1 Prepilin peptidase [Streptomyces sp. KY75]